MIGRLLPVLSSASGDAHRGSAPSPRWRTSVYHDSQTKTRTSLTFPELLSSNSCYAADLDSYDDDNNTVMMMMMMVTLMDIGLPLLNTIHNSQ